jgi:hypothetical protein
VSKVQNKRPPEDLSVDQSLNGPEKNMMQGCELDSTGLRQGSSAISHKYTNFVPSNYITGGKSTVSAFVKYVSCPGNALHHLSTCHLSTQNYST